MDFRSLIIQALEDRYNAQISEADATLKIYFNNEYSNFELSIEWKISKGK